MTEPDDATEAEEAREATKEHVADRGPTPEEEADADSNTLDESVAKSYKAADERGANIKGEGQIVPDGD